jgi:hypothetical protein
MRKAVRTGAARLILPSGYERPEKPRHNFRESQRKDAVPTLETNLEETIGVRKWLVSSIADAERQIGAAKLAKRGRAKSKDFEAHILGMELISNYLQMQLRMVDAALEQMRSESMIGSAKEPNADDLDLRDRMPERDSGLVKP